MPTNAATLHLVCGKIAAGKSTLIRKLGSMPGVIVVGEDQWLARLYPDTQNSLEDYARNAARLRAAMGPHLIALLRAGLSVALDFPANTPASRRWMRGLFEQAGVAHQLHVLDVTDAVCKARLRERNATGEHEFTVTDAQFDQFASHFVPPTEDEGFDVVLHRD
ncbi:AAA family ATPase [Sphingomonas colocasiae]|uniref:ATP-binding protein n=1 Tax=Sphingomonas colocasiae TaxID=1848973 RepID=A0ABS7PUK1_9SPHN|nr:ATP-binding protein [Sphingomonas colocasiae]MBY8825035.1 ATP-binding protein [Sphingomonas colocasiae]